MDMLKKFFVAALSAAVLMTGAIATDALAAKFATIGTGGITGVYYPTGGAIAKIINAKKSQYNIRASVESTGGSKFNINAINKGDLEFGIAQADTQYMAVKGLGDWEGKPVSKLRFVFALAPEAVTFIAAEDSGIKSIADVKGKTINLGDPGSGNRVNAMQVFKGYLTSRAFLLTVPIFLLLLLPYLYLTGSTGGRVGLRAVRRRRRIKYTRRY